MGNCTTYIDELRFDVRDDEFLHVYAFVRCEGDCMHFLPGWHHKAFPKTITSLEVMVEIANGHEDMQSWPREDPRPVETPTIFQPWEQVPVKVEHMQQWREYFAACNAIVPTELADQIGAYLAKVPDWHAACPYCRAQTMLRNAQQPGKSEQ